MNKNPFIPQPSYPHQQPPLPAGPAPPQPVGQPDYSAYWAAAAQQQPGAQPAYNPQWAGVAGTTGQWPGAQAQPTAAPKPPEQSALYANYGYGGQANAHWHQQQHQQQAQHHIYAQPAAPAVSMIPQVAPQPPGFNPYQPQTAIGYPQAYAPPAPPQPAAQQTFRPPQAPQQQQQQQQQYFNQQQQRPPTHGHVQHTPPHQVPPAKRQRFENSHQSNPPQPRFQPPPPPPIQPQNGPHPPNRPHSMNGPPQGNQLQSQGSFNGGRGGGMGGGRGGANMNRGGRGGNVGGNRGMGMNRGRGGGMYNSGARGGATPTGPLRAHQSRDRGGFGNFNRRGGGSFNGGQHHQQGSFRGGHGGRNMGGGHGNRGPRDGFHHNQNRGPSNATNASSASGSGKREENRRTLTDFKIVGLELKELDWQWGVIPTLPSPEDKKETMKVIEGDDTSENVKKEDADLDLQISSSEVKTEKTEGGDAESKKDVSNSATNLSTSQGAFMARMRIYFHTPPNADDARPIVPIAPASDVRKGKRKKLDDDDADADEERRAPPPPPLPSGADGADSDTTKAAPSVADADNSVGRGSVAPSVATEAASEADWLMAAIAEGDAEGDADAEGEVDAYEETQVDGLGEDVHDHDGEYEFDETMADSSTQDGLLIVDHVDAEAHVPHEKAAVAESQMGELSVTDVQIEKPNDSQRPEDSVMRVGQESSHSSGVGLVPSGDAPVGVTIVSPSVIAPSTEQSSSEGGEKPDGSAVTADTDGGAEEKPNETEHLPEPPASPTSNTAFSGTSSGSTNNPDLPAKPLAAAKLPSSNRVSISYAGGSRRLLIDAEIVDKLKVFRAEGRIEIDLAIERLADGFKGILIETLSNESKAYSPLQVLSSALDSDSTLPPFWRFTSLTKASLFVYLDKERPLSEPKWAKTGDVQGWLKDMFGGRFWVAGDAVGWEKKIEVYSPDPAPTIQSVLEGWSSNTPVGMPSERQRFLKTHMTEPDNVLEILLRLVRGERATAFSQSSSAISAPSITGPLLTAMDQSTAQATQQTHVSLAVVAIVRLATEFAEMAFAEGKGKVQVEDRVGEIIRCLPSHLLYKSLDGMFKEWRVEKKSGR